MTFLYPHNLLFVSLAAGLSFYLGFLPLQVTPRRLFIYLSFITILLWAVAAFISGLRVGGYILGCGLMATTAWRQFCLERDFMAKVWLSAATAFGGTLCTLMLVMVPKCPDGASVWFFTSVYFGAFVLTTAFMSAALPVLAERSVEAPKSFLENALVFSFLALGLRLVLLIAILAGFPKMFPGWGQDAFEFLTHQHIQQLLGWVGLGIVFPFGINFWSWNRLKKGATLASLWRPLAFSFLSVLAGEFLARMLYL